MLRQLTLILCLLPLPTQAATRWPQFRGPGGASVPASEEKPPVEFNPKTNCLWSTPIPPGSSSPCIWDDRIFLTGATGSKLETLCLRRSDGQILWRQPAPIEKLERTNHLNGPATPTPCTDGQRVYVLFGSYGLLAYDFEGHEAWHKTLPMGEVRHGSAASPILAAGKLIVNGDQELMKSFLIAVDPANGQTLWQIPRPRCFSSHTTPLYRKAADDADEVILSGSVRLVGYDLKDGSERWSVRGLEAISICPSPTLGDGMIFASSVALGEARLPTFDDLLKQCDKNGDGRVSWDEADKLTRDVFSILDTNNDKILTRAEWDAYYDIFKQSDTGLFAMRLPNPAHGDHGDLTDTHILWRQKRGIPEASSALFYHGRVFMIQNGGLASCLDAATGNPFYQTKRIGAPPAQYFASPIAANGKIYVASTGGVVSVIDAQADTLHVLAHNDLGEPIQATPAIIDDALYVRTAAHLFAFALPSTPARRAEPKASAPDS
jgi:outer membrane protein assembly factor BamB